MSNLMLVAALVSLSFQNAVGSSKFSEDIRNLFGALRQTALAQSFQQARKIQCSELVDAGGEWKQVAFLNDDPKIANWHFDTMDMVKSDPVTFIFSGGCASQTSPVAVATSFPVEESVELFHQGRIASPEMRRNDPVRVTLDRKTNAYNFRLPYLYIEAQTAHSISYTMSPPQTTSKPETLVAEDFLCKALSDATLTYRFLLCRTRLFAGDQALGNAGYYILSDGEEASTNVNLQFPKPK